MAPAKLKVGLVMLGIVCVIALMIIFRDHWKVEIFFGLCLAAQLANFFLILRDSPTDI